LIFSPPASLETQRARSLLPEPGAGRKRTAGRGSGKDVRFRDTRERGSGDQHRRNELSRRAIAFFLIVSPDQEEN
jgi:hypothetical protein